MNFKSKLNDIKKISTENIERLKDAHLSDLLVLYRKFLKRIPDISHLKNVILFSGIATFLIFILFSQRFEALYNYLPKDPVNGGTYTEGIVGTINQFNPLFTKTSSAEDTVSKLIFSGLTKENDKKQIIPDLVERWEVSSDEKTYTFYLKKNLLWSDGEPLSTDDVVFTIETIQNPDVRSPLLAVWKGVTVKKIDDQKITFTLATPYSGFLSNTDFSILPKHVLRDVPARSFKTSEFNNKPIGSGPFMFEDLKIIRDSQEVTLAVNKNYYGHVPYLDKIVIKTYSRYSDLTEAYAKREIMGMEKISGSELSQENKIPNVVAYDLIIPESDIIYFNLRNNISKEKFIREAISLTLPRKEITERVYSGYAVPLYTPIPPGFTGYNPKLKSSPDLGAAKNKILEAGYSLGPNGMMAKDGNALVIRLVCLDDYEKVYEAEIIRDTLKQIGVEVQIEKYPTASFFQDHVKNRDFDMLLITQNLGFNSDLYAFWHSSQVNDPGLNFSGLSDRKIDKFLEQARTSSDQAKSEQRYQDVQQVIWDNVAALPIVWPNYIYAVSREVKGVGNMKLSDPRDRFWNIENWYIFDKKATIL